MSPSLPIPAAGQHYIESTQKGHAARNAGPACRRLPSVIRCLDVTLPEITAYFGELLDNLRKERNPRHSVSTATVPLDILPPGAHGTQLGTGRTRRTLRRSHVPRNRQKGWRLYRSHSRRKFHGSPCAARQAPSMRDFWVSPIPFADLPDTATDETMLHVPAQPSPPVQLPAAAVPPDGSLFPRQAPAKEMEKGRGAAHGDERGYTWENCCRRPGRQGEFADAPYRLPIPRTGILGLYGPIHTPAPDTSSRRYSTTRADEP